MLNPHTIRVKQNFTVGKYSHEICSRRTKIFSDAMKKNIYRLQK